MAEISLAAVLVIVLLLGAIGHLLAKRMGLPGVVGMLIVGVVLKVILGYWGVGQEFEVTMQSLAGIGVVLLLFLLGLEFNLADLGKLKWISIALALVQVSLTTLLGLLILSWLGINGGKAVVLSLGLSLSSTAIVVKLLLEKKQTKSLAGRVMIGWLLVQDLAVVPILLLLPFLTGIDGGRVNFSWWLMGVILLIVTVFGLTSNKLFDYLARVGGKEVLVLATFGWGLGLGLLFERAGLSLALGGFVAGLMLSSSNEEHEIFARLTSLRDLFATVFFLSLGYMISVRTFLANWLIILTLVLIFALIKLFLALTELLLWKFHLRVAIKVAVGLMEAGEFALIMAVIAKDMGILSEEWLTILTSVVVLSMIMIPVWSKGETGLYKILNFWGRKLGIKHRSYNDLSGLKEKEAEVVLLGYGRFGSLVGKKFLKKYRKKLVAVDYNLTIVEGLAEKGVDSIYGDVLEEDVLSAAGVSKAKIVVIGVPDKVIMRRTVRLVRKMNNEALIVARVHLKSEVEGLKNLGVNRVVLVEEAAGRLAWSYIKAKLW